MAVLMCFLLSILSLLYILLHRRNQYWKIRKIPYMEPELFFGNSRGILRKFHAGEFMRRMYFQLKPKGPIGGVFVYIKTIAVVTDLDLVKNILVKDFQCFPNRGLYHDENDPLSCHLVNIEDEAWKSLRQKLSPAFTPNKLKGIFHIFTGLGDKLVRSLEKEMSSTRQVEIRDIMSRFTIDVIGSAAFGIECNSLEGERSQFYEAGLKFFKSFDYVKRGFMACFPVIAKTLHMKEYGSDVGNFYINVVKETIQLREENPNEKRNDMMSLMINGLNSKGPDHLTFDQVSAQCFVFFLAGFETSSTTLAFCMYELSLNQDIQAKARKSVIEALTRSGGCLTFEAIGEMSYLEQCINETLRKYPPFVQLQRTAKHDYAIPNSNLFIEKGTTICIPTYGIHWDPEIYPLPEIFDPNRFSSEETAKRHPFAFIPFGDGNRACIGIKFAMAEIKVALAKILKDYEFLLDRSQTSVPLTMAPKQFILSANQGIYLNFKKL